MEGSKALYGEAIQMIHLNELARNLEISRGSAKGYCDAFVEEGLIRESSKDLKNASIKRWQGRVYLCRP